MIGLGNPERGDDAAGRLVARRLLARQPHGLEVRECDGEATRLMDAWTGFDDVVLVDACRGAGEPGGIHHLTPDELAHAPWPLARPSSHDFGPAVAVALARALGLLPKRLAIYAIEGQGFGLGEPPSPPVDRAVDELVALLDADGAGGDRNA